VHRTAVLNVVGLTQSLLGPDTPHLSALARDGSVAPIRAVTPAVTCTAQATFLTGTLPRDHGIVGNGWYFRDLAQIWFWRQANQLVAGEKVWETARRTDPSCTCAKMFWWYNMYSSADWSVTPRPIYPSDGRKIPDIYSHPANLRERLTAEIGPFPFFKFWGPDAGLPSSQWIADASAAVERWSSPSLLLVYLPHLDYNMQRLGPDHPDVRADVRNIDTTCGALIATLRARGLRIVVLSEYGLVGVTQPVHINRALREAGLLSVREELGVEALDPGESRAFAVSDHQLAHVYVRDAADIAAVKRLLGEVRGIDAVLDRREQAALGLDHERSGELVAIAARESWFTYYYWLDDRVAPDYARTVDIHRKPGYDPVELHFDPATKSIPLDATRIKGSHGAPVTDDAGRGVLLSSQRGILTGESHADTDVFEIVLVEENDSTKSVLVRHVVKELTCRRGQMSGAVWE
jgi:predicted AlkP superfamily pyrophosphatase or phosphodiesterase